MAKKTPQHYSSEADQASLENKEDEQASKKKEELEEQTRWRKGVLVEFQGVDSKGNPRCWQRVTNVVWTIQALNDLVRSKVGLSNDQPFEMSILKDDKSGYVSLDDDEDVRAFNVRLRRAAALDLITTIRYTLPAVSRSSTTSSSTSSSSSSDISVLIPHQPTLSTVEEKEETATLEDEHEASSSSSSSGSSDSSSSPELNNDAQTSAPAAQHPTTIPTTVAQPPNPSARRSPNQPLASSSSSKPPLPSFSTAPPPPAHRSTSQTPIASTSTSFIVQPHDEKKRKLIDLDAPSESSTSSSTKKPKVAPLPSSSSKQRRSSSSSTATTTSTTWLKAPSPPPPTVKKPKPSGLARVVQQAEEEPESKKQDEMEVDELDSSQYKEDSQPIDVVPPRGRKRKDDAGVEAVEREKRKSKKEKGKERETRHEEDASKSSWSVKTRRMSQQSTGASGTVAGGQEKEERRLTRSEKGKGRVGEAQSRREELPRLFMTVLPFILPLVDTQTLASLAALSRPFLHFLGPRLYSNINVASIKQWRSIFFYKTPPSLRLYLGRNLVHFATLTLPPSFFFSSTTTKSAILPPHPLEGDPSNATFQSTGSLVQIQIVLPPLPPNTASTSSDRALYASVKRTPLALILQSVRELLISKLEGPCPPTSEGDGKVWVYVVVQGGGGGGKKAGDAKRKKEVEWVERVRRVVWERERKWTGREEGEDDDDDDEAEGVRRLERLVKVVGRRG